MYYKTINEYFWDSKLIELAPKMREFFLYSYMKSDFAGFLNSTHLVHDLGFKITRKEVLDTFQERVIFISESRLWIPEFATYCFNNCFESKFVLSSLFYQLKFNNVNFEVKDKTLILDLKSELRSF
jgi:hypothetical protein